MMNLNLNLVLNKEAIKLPDSFWDNQKIPKLDIKVSHNNTMIVDSEFKVEMLSSGFSAGSFQHAELTIGATVLSVLPSTKITKPVGIEMNLERHLLFAALEEIKISHPTAHIMLSEYVMKKVQEEQENEE